MDILASPRFICVLGPPGVGKGTLFSLLSAEYKIPYFSVGDYLRAIRDRPEQSALTGEIKPYLERGEILPAELGVNVVKEKLERMIGNTKVDGEEAVRLDRVIIDGFPRTVDQEVTFRREVCDFWLAVELKCCKEAVEKRFLRRGREKDNEKLFKTRYAEFERENPKLAECFRQKGKLIEVDSSEGEEVAFQELIQVLNKSLLWRKFLGRQV